MEDNSQKIAQLLEKLEVLQGVHTHFAKEIQEIREEIRQLQQAPETVKSTPITEQTPQNSQIEKQERDVVIATPSSSKLVRDPKHKILGGVCAGMAHKYGVNLFIIRLLWVLFALLFCVGALVYVVLWATLPIGEALYKTHAPEVVTPAMQTTSKPTPSAPKKPSVDLEKYIGENLISKIGIAVLVIGVGIGAKYSIDNDLISPLVRIILGYTMGAALLVISQRLKKKYENFSAVLVSGAMAIFYFMTFAAYSFYDMFSPITAFALMVLVTFAAVGAALNYNKQFIAHIGLVGAYCIPFLLSEGKGQVLVLFSYMTIINAGILVVAFKRYWKPLYLVAFFVTWLIVLSWHETSYETTEHFSVLLGFGFVFFVLFYLTFLGYKLLKKEPLEVLDIVLVLVNSFVFYGLGYSLLKDMPEWEAYLGLYTLLHAVIHGVVGLVIYQQKGVDKPIFYLVSGMFLVFVTLSIPVQLDGNWVTLLWLGEAALLFWIGRTKQLPIYEKIAYPMILLAFISLLQDWSEAYYDGYFIVEVARFPSLLNVTFLSSLLFCGVLGYLNYLNYNKKYLAAFSNDTSRTTAVSVVLTGLLLLVLYFTFSLEIAYYWEGLFRASASDNDAGNFGRTFNYDYHIFKSIWGLLYFLIYATLLLAINNFKIKSRLMGMLGLALAAIGLLSFLTIGLYELSELRESYLDEEGAVITASWFYLGIRYLAIGLVVALLAMAYRYLKHQYQKVAYGLPFDLILSVTILWTASSELLHWLDIVEAQDSYKLWLTIFWGVYALGLSSIGIWKSKKHLRVAAIVLFGITLIKLFLYDLADLSTLSKTVVFVSLGILLLLISFLYNKFKELIIDKEED
ncbi:DUF2339 domain-containing protein [Muriicola sp.]|uniref:DUF2339 domain-containing protein n=1 Tax=Muriicola sp. TaxID=2020856 RepID=UPI003C7883EC